jgi:tRNA pseudouridine55 synthase
MATGVLVIAVGEATKLMPWLTHHDKVYSACVALGVETDTHDAWGLETRRLELGTPLRDALRGSRAGAPAPLVAAALQAERTRTSQAPPEYSAIHCGGERAYQRARRGESPDLAAREVTVHDLCLVACREDPPTLSITMRVSKGYYVRALARDLGHALGTVAHLTSLRRTRSGMFSLDHAARADDPPDALREAIVPLAESAALALPVARLTDAGARDARQGRTLVPEQIRAPTREPSAWLDPAGDLVAVGRMDEDGRGRVIRGFRSAVES